MSDSKFGIYVGNVDSSISLEVLKQLFSQCGNVTHASLNGRETDPYRYGFLDFDTEQGRDNALQFNGYKLAERSLKVGVSRGIQTRNDRPATHGYSAVLASMSLPQTPGNWGYQHHFQHQQPPPAMDSPYGAPGYMMDPMASAAATGGAPAIIASRAPGNFHGPGSGLRGQRYSGGVNEPPSAETLRLRELQRQQYMETVLKEYERYHRKLEEHEKKKKKEKKEKKEKKKKAKEDKKKSTKEKDKKSKEKSPVGEEATEKKAATDGEAAAAAPEAEASDSDSSSSTSSASESRASSESEGDNKKDRKRKRSAEAADRDEQEHDAARGGVRVEEAEAPPQVQAAQPE